MAAIADLARRVLPLADGAPEPLAAQFYLDAARDFFTRTRAWVDQELFLVRTQPRAGYALFEADLRDAELFDTWRVSYDGQPLAKLTFEQMEQRLTANPGRPRYHRISAGNLIIAPAPGPGGELRGAFCLRPTRGAYALDDRIADEFGEIIEHGTLARLLNVPHKDWTDREAVGYYRALFTEAVDDWRSRAADDGQVGVPRRVRYGGY